jgi:hypothetical protein
MPGPFASAISLSAPRQEVARQQTPVNRRPRTGPRRMGRGGCGADDERTGSDLAYDTWQTSCPDIGCSAKPAIAGSCKVGLDAWSGSRPSLDCNFGDAGACVGWRHRAGRPAVVKVRCGAGCPDGRLDAVHRRCRVPGLSERARTSPPGATICVSGLLSTRRSSSVRARESRSIPR